jgi:phage shock protein C
MNHLAHKKLYRSKTDRVFTGVCGGLAEYLHIDSNFLRLIWVFAVIITGLVPGVLVYIIAFAIVPEKLEATTQPASESVKNTSESNSESSSTSTL